MKEDEEEEEEFEEEEDEEEDSLLTSAEPFRKIAKLILAKFTVKKEVVTDGQTNQWTDRPTDGATNRWKGPLVKMRGLI